VPQRVFEIHLQGLDPNPSKDVLLGVVRRHGGEIDDRHLQWCVAVAEGNPYFLEELANHWIETAQAQSVPSSLAAMLNERLSRLAPASLQLLQTCAVLEKNSTLRRVEEMLDYKAHNMLPAINELGRAGMLITENSDSQAGAPDRFATRHDLLSNAALARLSTPALAFLHARAAAILEKEIHSDNSATILWDCAKHWQLSGDVGHALGLAQSCAAHLLDIGLSSAAAEAYDKTFAYCSTVEERLEIWKGLAHAHYRSRSWKNVTRAVIGMRKLMPTDGSGAANHDEFELMAHRATWHKVGPASAVESALRCLHASEASINHRVEAGGTALMIGDEICDHGLMKRVFNDLGRLWATNNVDNALRLRAEMVYHSVCGDLEIGLSAARELLSAKRANGNVGDLWSALLNAASVFRTAGLFAESEGSLREALAIAERHNLVVSASTALDTLSHLFLETGEIEKARECYSLLRSRRYSRREDPASTQKVHGLGVRLALTDRRYREALRLTRNYRAEESAKDPFVERRVYNLALIVASHLMIPDEAFGKEVTLLEEAHLLARAASRKAFSTFTLYRGLSKIGRKRRANQLLKEYLTKYRREPWPPGDHILKGLPA